MANYFTLTRVGETEPAKFSQIDAELCHELGVEVDDDKYVWGWYDFFGMAIAMGRTPDQIQAILNDCPGDSPEVGAKILTFLRTFYEWDAWARFGRAS